MTCSRWGIWDFDDSTFVVERNPDLQTPGVNWSCDPHGEGMPPKEFPSHAAAMQYIIEMMVLYNEGQRVPLPIEEIIALRVLEQL